MIMNGFRNWLQRLGAGMTRFMSGRYGMDKLNSVILWSGVAVAFIGVFIPVPMLGLTMTALSYIMVLWAVFRCFSRNTYKRYRENRRFLMLIDRIKDRDHKYFDCPRCRQPVRVPRKKGKIAITCPKCKEKFIRKT